MRKLILILLMLFGGAVHADLNPSVDSLRTMAFEQSLIPDAGNAIIDLAYGNRVVNRAIQRVCMDLPAIDKLDTIVSVAEQIEYSLNTDFYRLSNIFKLTTSFDLKIIYSLSFPPVDGWFEARAGEVGGEGDPQQKPEPRYAWTFNDKLYFYPTPQRADSFVVAYYAIDSQIVTSSNSTSVRPEYREAIVLYAASLICYRLGDFARAEIYRQLYNSRLGVSAQIRQGNE